MALPLYLASRSPRRRELLGQLGLAFRVIDVQVVETRASGQSPGAYALAMARAKARAGRQAVRRAAALIGADTDVVLDDDILGKPADAAQAVEMLRRLSGRTHEVYSGVALAAHGRTRTALSVTRVTFGRITRAAARAYWRTGEPADKAGAYAIQGRGARFVRRIEGSYSGVVGLPLFETLQLLQRAGLVR